MVRPRRKQQPRQRMPQELAAFAPGGAMAVDRAAAKEGVRLALARELHLARSRDPAGDVGRAFPGGRRNQFGFARRRDLELDVDAIGQRARNAPAIARYALGRAAAASAAVAAMSTGAGIHGRQELKASRILHLARGAGNGVALGFDRLPEGLDQLTVELRQFVQKQHSVMRERNLPGAGNLAPTDERGSPGAVVRRAKRTLAPTRGVEAAGGYRMHRGHLECVALREGRQDAPKA